MPPTRSLCVVLLAALLAATPAATAQAKVVSTEHMYGDRYCEYLVVKGTPPSLTADVWNTYGLNACPAAAWRASDPAALARRLGALGVILNGPRYWLMDSTSVSLAHGFGAVATFGDQGLRMRRVATVDVPVSAGRPGQLPYRETVVHRRTSFVFSRRHPVHELVSAGGKVYVMQTYAQIADPHLSRSDLRALGRRLHLPSGWRYRTRSLHRDLRVRAAGRAHVLQDELGNTYQLER